VLRKFAQMLHGRITASGAAAPSVPVILFALQIITNTVSITVATLVIGLLTGSIGQTALTVVAFAIIRYLSGGYHLKINAACIVVSTAILAVIPHITLGETANFSLTVVSVIIFALFAPSNYDKYARMPRRYYPLLKIVSIGLVAVNLGVRSDVLALTYIIQSGLLIAGKWEEKRR